MAAMKLAVLPGDGTGPEVTAEALKVIEAVSKIDKFEYTTQEFDYGVDRYLSTGHIIDSKQIEELRRIASETN